MHTPVLLKEVIENLDIKAKGTYIDATFGEGGYSKAIIEERGRVLAIDLDEKQLSGSKIGKIENLKMVQGNFSNIEKIAKENDYFPVDGIVFDLGLSMGQLDNSGRGFSYKKLMEPLDMRIDPNSKLTAFDLIRNATEDELYEIIARNSEELAAREIARTIKYGNHLKRINTVGNLIYAIDKAIGEKSNRVYRKIFQALRIEVNHEFENLKKGLEGAVSILKKDGKIVIVTFHSLEDRIVKNFVRSRGLKFANKKPVISFSGRSFEKSAKLRVITL